MRTARFIGSWLAAAIALTLAVTLFLQWIGFVLDSGGAGSPMPLLLWMAFGANLLAWSLVGVVRLGDDSVRALISRRAAAGAPARAPQGPRGRGGDRAAADRVLV
ncbi:glycosyltransferase family 2 protein, partial [Streptomonospora nanhaiensis]